MDFKKIETEILELEAEKVRIIEELTFSSIPNLREAVKTNKRIVEIEQRVSELVSNLDKIIITTYKVYIIESPASKDLAEKRNEGVGMTQYLGLAEIETEYFMCQSVSDIEFSFTKISADINQLKKNKKEEEIICPIIHFSGHGNEDLIGLTDESVLKWQELGQLLYKLNSDIGIDLENTISELIVTLSVCKGASFNKVIKKDRGTPFYIMLGANETIPWSDALLGFQIFFHHLIHKSKTIGYAIKKMKIATDYNDFEHYTDSSLKLKEE